MSNYDDDESTGGRSGRYGDQEYGSADRTGAGYGSSNRTGGAYDDDDDDDNTRSRATYGTTGKLGDDDEILGSRGHGSSGLETTGSGGYGTRDEYGSSGRGGLGETSANTYGTSTGAHGESDTYQRSGMTGNYGSSERSDRDDEGYGRGSDDTGYGGSSGRETSGYGSGNQYGSSDRDSSGYGSSNRSGHGTSDEHQSESTAGKIMNKVGSMIGGGGGSDKSKDSGRERRSDDY